MRIDNNSLDPERPPNPKEVAFCKKSDAILAKLWDMEYVDVVRAYRQLEEEFVNHAGYNEWEVLETKRRIAESILLAAHEHEQPFEVCRDNWNALVELGFSSIDTYCNYVWFYADSCLFNAQYDVGLDVLDMVLMEIHRRLDEPGLTRQAEKFYDQNLTSLGKLRERTVAYKSSEAEGIAWDKRRDAEIEAEEDQESNPQKKNEAPKK